MYDTDAHHRYTAGHGGIDTCKMVLDVCILCKPRGVVMDRSGIVPFGLSLHGNPGKVRDTDRNTAGSLPVAMQLVSAEIKVPGGYAVQFAHHALTSVLPHNGLTLLCSGKLVPITEHINSRNLKSPIETHHLAAVHGGLVGQICLRHCMPGKSKPMPITPCTALIAVCRNKAFADMIVVMITNAGCAMIGQIPDQFRQVREQLFPISIAEGFLEIKGVGKYHILPRNGSRKCALGVCLRFIGEDGGNCTAEAIANRGQIRLIGQVNKATHGFRRENIDIGLSVVAWCFGDGFVIGIPVGVKNRFRIHGIADKLSVCIQRDRISAKQAAHRDRIIVILDFMRRERSWRKAQKLLSETRMARNKPACETGWPTVLVV